MNGWAATQRDLNRLKNSHEAEKGERQSPAYTNITLFLLSCKAAGREGPWGAGGQKAQHE